MTISTSLISRSENPNDLHAQLTFPRRVLNACCKKTQKVVMFLFSMHWVRKVVFFMDMKIAQNFLKGINEALPLPSFLGILFLLFSQLAERIQKKEGTLWARALLAGKKKERNHACACAYA